MKNQKIEAGADFPALWVSSLDASARVDISRPDGGYAWRMVVVYRGRHCPMCTRYLNQLTTYAPRLREIGVDVVAVSGDSAAQLTEHLERLNINYPIYHGLTVEQMRQLGLYISSPRSPKETDHPFAEPGVFVINERGTVQVVDISNNPFVRPSLDVLTSGLSWIRSHEYPIRGTH